MRQQQVQRQPRKRSRRRDHAAAEPASRARRLAGPDLDDTLLARIDHLLATTADPVTRCCVHPRG